MRNIITALLALLAAAPAAAQEKTFTLEDLNFGGTNYRRMTPARRWYQWWGEQAVRVDAEACYTVGAKDGTETELLSLAALQQATEGRKAKLTSLYSATFPYPTRTVVRLTTGKEDLLIDWKQGKVVEVHSREGIEASAWCAASGAYAYVKGDNLHVEQGGKDAQLTTDGSRNIVYGQSVHRDEFGIDGGLFWNPQGTRLAFYRMDQSMVADYPQVDITTRIAAHEPDKYPMAGETSHKVQLGVYDIATGETHYLKTADPTDRYFTNVAWSPDGSTIYMFELNRDQNDCQLISYDAATGEKKAELYREQSDKYVEPLHPIVFLPWDDTQFILQSQRDGYNHLYLYKADGTLLRRLTWGQFVVTSFVGFNTKAKSLIIRSNETSPIQQNLWAVDIKTLRRTPIDSGTGVHSAQLSATGQHLIDTWSAPDVPRTVHLTATATGKRRALFTAPDPWQGYKVPEYTCGTIKADDGQTDLYWRMVKPTDFDPAKKYPTIIYVYGGPHAHNVDASWHYCSRGWETYMAQKGYLLFILDNRGSEHRGRDFEQATFRQLGQVEMRDQMQGVAYLKSLPYVDADRIGVHGWSFGGFMTISLMTNHPDVFKVGVAGGPVIDWKWYEVMYGERYMDTPQTNPEGYAKTSLLAKAGNLKGKLQIITGYNDRTVVPQHCLSFLAACIQAGTQPDFFAYPGEPHNMRGHQSTHLHERISQYFDDYLK